MMKFGSIEKWKNYCFATHKNYLRNKYYICWIKKKNIDIHNYTLLKKKEIKYIIQAIKNAARVIGNFKVKLHKSKLRKPNFAVEGENIIGARILKMIKRTRKNNKRCNASIFLVNQRVKSNQGLLKFGDALTYVPEGIIIFTFDSSKRYPNKFFKSAIAHEIHHLIGFNSHHEDTTVKGYNNLETCNMQYNAPSSRLCRKCTDGLLAFWKGVKYATA